MYIKTWKKVHKRVQACIGVSKKNAELRVLMRRFCISERLVKLL